MKNQLQKTITLSEGALVNIASLVKSTTINRSKLISLIIEAATIEQIIEILKSKGEK